MRRSASFLLLTFVTSAALAQPLGALREQRGTTAPPSAPAQKRPLAAEPVREPALERCRNMRREMRQIARREREARTTGEADQLALRRQQIMEQSSRAGC
jgi:hypothetical protein